MTDIHDIKPLMDAPFPWLAVCIFIGISAYIIYKIRAWYISRQKISSPQPVHIPEKSFDYKTYTLKELNELLLQIDNLYTQHKEAYIYALISYWLRFYLEHHTKKAALTMTKKEIKTQITDTIEHHLAECYRIEFAKKTSDPAHTKQFITLLIQEITHGI